MLSDMVMIGDLKMTRAALITLTMGFLLSFCIAVFIPHGILIGLITFFGFIVAAYNVNCSIVGKCNNWAIFLVVIYVIYVILNLLLIFTDKKKYMKMVIKKK